VGFEALWWIDMCYVLTVADDAYKLMLRKHGVHPRGCFLLVPSFLFSGVGHYCSSFQSLRAMMLPLAILFLSTSPLSSNGLATMEKSERLRLRIAISNLLL
jgi:hypothetical protein